MAVVNPIPAEFIDKLDPQFVEIYNKYAASRIRADQVSIEEFRANPAEYQVAIPRGATPEVATVTTQTIRVQQPEGEIEARIYRPTDSAIQAGRSTGSDGRLAAYVNYHGGGWVIGNLNTDEPWCRQACQKVGCVVVDVNYRHGPEFPFPAAVWDAFLALKWVFESAEQLGVDPTRVSVGGLSAGGHLSAVVAHLARDAGLPPLRLQLLVVPCLDMRWTPIEGSCGPDTPYKSYHSLEFTPCLPLQRMRWFSNLWVGQGDDREQKTKQPIASPILFPSHANVAPASIHVAEYDILGEEAEAYHNELRKIGVPSELAVYKGVCHPFAMWDGVLDKGKECNANRIQALQKAVWTEKKSETVASQVV